MKSVGETMGIGRTFIEAFVKAKRGLEAISSGSRRTFIRGSAASST